MKTTVVLIGLMLCAAFKPAPAKAQVTQGVVCVGFLVTGTVFILLVDGKCRTPYYAVWDADAPGDCWCEKTTPRAMRIENWKAGGGPFKKAQKCYDFLNSVTNCPPSGVLLQSEADEPDDPPVEMIVERSTSQDGPWETVKTKSSSPDSNDELYREDLDKTLTKVFFRVRIDEPIYE